MGNGSITRMTLRALAMMAVAAGVIYADEIRVTDPTSIVKVLPVRGTAGSDADVLRIAMCRGEYEPAQIVVHAGKLPLTNVRVSVSGLVGATGDSLKRDRITVNPIGFVNCKIPTYGYTPLLGEKGGEVPDVLLPDRPIDVPAGRRQPYYITVRTLQTDSPGEYSGIVHIAADGREARQVPLVVRVYDITLPIKSHLRTAFGIDTGYRKLPDAQPGTDMDSLLRYSKILLQHRISPMVYGSSVENTGILWRDEFWRDDGTFDTSGVDRYLSELAPLGLTTFYTGWMGSVAVYADHLKAKGWWDLAFVYGHDEAPMDRLPKMREDYKQMKRVVPDAKAVQVAWSPVKPLEGLIDIWCPLLSAVDTHTLHEARERGEETWWYVCNAPKSPYPNFSFIDYRGIDARITAWMTYHYGFQGFLYYAVDIWNTHVPFPDGKRLSVDEYDKANYANWDPDTYKKDRTGKRPRNGCGWLIYPGKNNTPIPSLRLALVRDAFEDYDAFKEVEELATGSDEAAAQVREILDFSMPFDAPIIISEEKWTKESHVLMQRREEILMTGEQLGRPEDSRLRALREATDLDAIYYVEKKVVGFGATPPKEGRYADGTDYEALHPTLRTVATLPTDGWQFKDDPHKVGTEEGYYRPDYPIENFIEIKTGQFWDWQGFEGLEEGWYRLEYVCPMLPSDKRVFLHFDAVDESAWVYIDGKQVAWYDTAYPSITWVEPFLLDVTGALTSGGEHLLVIRVGNTAGAGGVYKPVSLMVEK
jgi:hypothetical protein